MVFWITNKEKSLINSKEFEELYKKNVELSGEIEKIKVKLAIIDTNFDYLHSKLRKKTTEKEENTSVLLPSPQILNTNHPLKY